MTTESESMAQLLEATPHPIGALARAMAAGALAGFAAGLIAGGIGSRIAMRISAIAAGDRFQGAETEFQATVGEITAGGTIGLVLAGGAIGVIGGLVYLAVRRWLADAGQWRGLAFGVILLAIFGSGIVEGDNQDFHLFGPPTLNIAMFGSLFILFGLLVAPLFERIERALSPLQGRPTGLGPRAASGLGLLLVPLALPPFAIVASGSGIIILPYVFGVVPIASLLIARASGRFERLSDLWEHRWAMAAALAVLAAPVIAGLVLDALAVADIFEANR